MLRTPNQIWRTCVLALTIIALGSAGARASDWWQLTVVDSAGDVGDQSSLTILPSGQPAIAYSDNTNHVLKYVWFDGSVWHSASAQATPYGLSSTDIAGLPSGQPAIGYIGGRGGAGPVYYAWLDDSGWHRSLVDPAHGYFTSLTILPSGQPAMCYGGVMYAWLEGGVWNRQVVDTVGGGGGVVLSNLGFVVLPSGHPAIAYYSGFLYVGSLKYAVSDGQTWHRTVVDSQPGVMVGISDSMALLASGYPAIGYQTINQSAGEYTVKYAWFDGVSWSNTLVDGTGHVGEAVSLAILPAGQPAIAYSNGFYWTGEEVELLYAQFDGQVWHIGVVDHGGQVGDYASLAILPTGQPAISYYDRTNGDLKYAVRRAVSGDANCDGRVDFGDIDAFVLALTGEAEYQSAYPDCRWLNADINADGLVNAVDIDPFVALLSR